MKLKEKSYQTKSIELASYLLSKNYPLIKTEDNGNNRIVFVFEVKPEIERDLQEFNSGTALVQIRYIFSSLDRIKDLIWDYRRK